MLRNALLALSLTASTTLAASYSTYHRFIPSTSSSDSLPQFQPHARVEYTSAYDGQLTMEVKQDSLIGQEDGWYQYALAVDDRMLTTFTKAVSAVLPLFLPRFRRESTLIIIVCLCSVWQNRLRRRFWWSTWIPRCQMPNRPRLSSTMRARTGRVRPIGSRARIFYMQSRQNSNYAYLTGYKGVSRAKSISCPAFPFASLSQCLRLFPPRLRKLLASPLSLHLSPPSCIFLYWDTADIQ